MRLLLVLFIALALHAEGTSPKASAAAYPAHAELKTISIGAEYQVHSFSGATGTFIAHDYLVVEVALYPPLGRELAVSQNHFRLRLNGKTRFPQPPQFVAASLKYPDWEYRPRMEAEAGVGNSGVILGRPVPAERFPGDPTPSRRLPNPPRAPDPNDRAGIDKEAPVRADEVVIASALPEVPAAKPISGYLYFAYKGKTKPIKSLELIYDSPAGMVKLPLLP